MGEKLDKTKTDPREPDRKVPQYQSRPDVEDEVEISSEDSFPASDPPSYSSISHTGKPRHGETGKKNKP